VALAIEHLFDSLRLLAELGDVQGRLDDLKRRLRELAAGA